MDLVTVSIIIISIIVGGNYIVAVYRSNEQASISSSGVSKEKSEISKSSTITDRSNQEIQGTLLSSAYLTRQLLGLVGSIILIVGVFAPVVSIPVVGEMNYLQEKEGYGMIVLVLAIISLILTLAKQYKGLWFTGAGSLGVMMFTLINFQSRIDQIRTEFESEFSKTPLRGLGDIAMQSIQFKWGWALLIIGVVFVIASAAIKDET